MYHYFTVWVAESDNEVVGLLILMFENDHVTIANVAVRPDFQGTGPGRRLMYLAESEANTDAIWNCLINSCIIDLEYFFLSLFVRLRDRS
ncbi:GNAT family N-acetyltransferase [Methanococcoides methylutens]|uniref:GNAT family N-acetyltransferase n=1 Tax=Methanococcoides methylutens TaxID=2226 RepID=UPI00404450A9